MVIKVKDMTEDEYLSIIESGLFGDEYHGYEELSVNLLPLVGSIVGSTPISFETYQQIATAVTNGMFYALALDRQYPEVFNTLRDRVFNGFKSDSKADQAAEAILFTGRNVLNEYLTISEYKAKQVEELKNNEFLTDEVRQMLIEKLEEIKDASQN